MSTNLEELISRAEALWTLGLLPPEDTPGIASQALAEGFDGPALLELAMMQSPGRREVGDLFDKVLLEMGRSPIPKEQAGYRIARMVAREIVSGQTQPYGGSRQIAVICSYLGYPEDLTTFFLLVEYYEEDGCVPRTKIEEEIIEEARKLVEGQS